MHDSKVLLASVPVVVCSLSALTLAVETGDFDGDGLLTIRDVALLQDTEKDPTLIFAPGSFEAFGAFPAYVAAQDKGFYEGAYVITSVYMEILRRTLAGPFPSFSFVHWPTTWLMDEPQRPLPPDPRATLRLLEIEVPRGTDRVAVELELEVTAPVRAFSFAVWSPDGILRVPWIWAEQWSRPLAAWNRLVWALVSFVRAKGCNA